VKRSFFLLVEASPESFAEAAVQRFTSLDQAAVYFGDEVSETLAMESRFLLDGGAKGLVRSFYCLLERR